MSFARYDSQKGIWNNLWLGKMIFFRYIYLCIKSNELFLYIKFHVKLIIFDTIKLEITSLNRIAWKLKLTKQTQNFLFLVRLAPTTGSVYKKKLLLYVILKWNILKLKMSPWTQKFLKFKYVYYLVLVVLRILNII